MATQFLGAPENYPDVKIKREFDYLKNQLKTLAAELSSVDRKQRIGRLVVSRVEDKVEILSTFSTQHDKGIR